MLDLIWLQNIFTSPERGFNIYLRRGKYIVERLCAVRDRRTELRTSKKNPRLLSSLRRKANIVFELFLTTAKSARRKSCGLPRLAQRKLSIFIRWKSS
jgi:hypothetical protein